jgi:hypothetical protein
MGINLGPVKLVKDINGHPNIIGDGINVAQRIMSFARPGQIVVSRSYYDVVSNLASEYAKLFSYEGSRTDKHVREHEIYVVGHHEGALQKAKDGMKDRASSTTPNPPRKSDRSTGAQTVTLTVPAFVNDKKKLSLVAGGLALVVLILGVLVALKKPSTTPTDVVAATTPAEKAPAKPASTEPPKPVAEAPKPAEPAKPAEPPKADAKPETKVLEPTPSAAVIPPAGPHPADSKQAMTDVKKEGEKAAKDKAAADAKASDAKTDAAKAAPPPATLVFAVFPVGRDLRERQVARGHAAHEVHQARSRQVQDRSEEHHLPGATSRTSR